VLVARAVRRTGLSDFGDWAFDEPLRVWLAALEREADLSLFGRVCAIWDAERFLTNLLRLRAAEQAAPDVLAEPITAPLVVTGLPRSGTSFLHGLLAEDPASRVPRCWQTIYPCPETPAGAADPRPARVGRQLKLFEAMTPQFGDAHPLAADDPQECSEITAHPFRSLRFDMTHHVPSYREWLDAAGHDEAYRFHRRFLQHLQAQARRGDGGDPVGGGRWVLKCPDHVFALEAVRATYPDARFVFCHRDPLKVLASSAQLLEIVRRPFTRRVDRAAVGRQESERWRLGAGRMLAAARDDPGIFHLRHTELIADPLGAVAALYRHFGMTLTPEARRRMGDRVRARPSGGYRPRRYRLEDYGLDPGREREQFAEYAAFFEVAGESGASASAD
jgi:hypothetical protein